MKLQEEHKSKSIIWVLNRLSDVGGGEKLLLEGVAFYRKLGYRVYTITWEFNEKALFNGMYDNVDIIDLGENIRPRNQIFRRAFDRLKSLYKYRKIVKTINPDLIFCQGEYDVAVNYVATLFLPFKCVFLIFGQMFQYPHDISKYSLVFRKNLKLIRNSQEGYRTTIPLKMPNTALINKVSNEVISFIRYKAVRKASVRFVFSKSMKWETQMLFGVDTHIVKGAYSKSIFNTTNDTLLIKKAYNIPEKKITILSFSRLDPKKRIDSVIKTLPHLDKDIILLIAGTGSDLERLKQISESLKLQDRILFLGYVPEKDANPLKESCDLFISMDIGDFDISPFEAMALGKKVIFSTEIDLDIYLNQFKNLYVSSTDSNELAETIKLALLNETELYKEIMERYTWENYFTTILDIFKKSTLFNHKNNRLPAKIFYD